MKNILVKSLVVSSLLSSVVLADNSFIGVFGGYTDNSEMEYKDKEYGLKSKFDDNMPNIGIKAGYDFDSFKVYGAYRYSFKGSYKNKKFKIGGQSYDIKTTWKIHDLIVGFDFTPEVSTIFKPVFGVYAGASAVNYDFKNAQDGSSDGIRGGIVYGAKIGGAFEIAQNAELEVGYQIDQSRYVEVDDVKMKNTKRGTYLGINYKF